MTKLTAVKIADRQAALQAKNAKPAAVQFVELTYKKETPGTFVFANENEGCIVPQLYVKKAAFPNGAPKSIKIVIEILER